MRYIRYLCTEMSKLHVEIPDDEHRQLKAKAALQGLTIIEAVVQAIRDWLRKHEAHKG